jgi:hypothetical protein
MNETALEHCRELYVDHPWFCYPPPQQTIPYEYQGVILFVFVIFAVCCLGIAFYMIATDKGLK